MRTGSRQIRTVRVVLLSILLAFFALKVGKAQEQKQPERALVAGEGSAQYAGSDTCKTCHEDLYKRSFENTPHFKTTLENGHGCESCHGPGAAHAAAGGDISKIISFKKLSRQESSARCLSCHGESHKQSRFAQSAHAGNDVGCVDCHSPHHAKEEQHLLVASQPQLCYTCHGTQKAEFGKPYHHRVDEGLVECSDCHNVHGTGTIRQVRTLPSGDAVCYKCHADKQGPFVYEHVPVKTEGCSSCHTPHGSTNPRLLRVSQINLLCLQCHTFPTQGPAGPAHNQSQKYQACTMCHEAIHGSNFSNVFFK
ncbi:MAG TPA: DmsE family decaheme c-type cytochrome [Terriglobales bacterium]|nr:DmsE family decaheme c-type cytochrome [Terriglobales bacterium]